MTAKKKKTGEGDDELHWPLERQRKKMSYPDSQWGREAEDVFVGKKNERTGGEAGTGFESNNEEWNVTETAMEAEKREGSKKEYQRVMINVEGRSDLSG